jgi:hypothetical protein
MIWATIATAWPMAVGLRLGNRNVSSAAVAELQAAKGKQQLDI